MSILQNISICSLMLCFMINSGWGLTCEDPAIKVTIKTTTPDQIDDYEQFLFQGVMAYAVRKFCGESLTDFATQNCPGLSAQIGTDDVIISDPTDRFAMCVEVNNCSPLLLQEAIKTSQPQFNGALMQTDNTLLYEGVPVTLKPEVEPAFPTWLIPYIIFMSLVVLSAIAIISYTVYKSKKKAERRKLKMEEDDGVYENGGLTTGDEPTVTAM